MNDPSRSSDEELANSLSASDDHAIAALAGRYTQSLYDFALRATLDPAVAAAITRSSIEYLRLHAHERPETTNVRAWLFAFAQEQVLAVATDRARGPEVRISAGDRRFTQTDSGTDREVALWAWQAARSLRPRDYCLLDLTLRRGIAPEDVAGTAAQGRGGVYGALGRARGGFDEAYIATALYFRGREACAGLTELVGGSSVSMRVGIRRQIASHVESCDICQATLDALPSAAQVFAELSNVDLPPELPDQVLAGLAAAAAASQMTLADAALASEPVVEEYEVEIEPEVSETEAAPVVTEEQMWAPDEDEAPPVEEPEPAVAFAETRAPAFEPPRRAAPIIFGGPYEDERRGPLGFLRSGLLWSYVWLGVSTAVAIYIGIAAADSLRGGGGNGGDRALGTGNVRNIPCASGPLTLNHGTTQAFQFDPGALDGFEIDSVAVSPQTNANRNGLSASAQDGSTVEVRAAQVQATTARVDQFVLQIEWARGDEGGRSNCTVAVNVTPSATP
ncbi:MAG TPA: hypothetical protein VG845_06080 [Dehalococcoidia bacterium]|nr:hypothetical protein [Dehalococcoidia bacterium]